jgi:ABC-type lipoprotein release transport system permease subunit
VELLLFYGLRNLVARRVTTLLAAGGMALVVFVFAAVVMLAAGLERTLVDTGSPDNATVIRRSAGTEVQSGIERDQAAVVESQPEVAFGDDGNRLAAKELVVLIVLQKQSGSRTNVVIRGTDTPSLALRPNVRVVAGRLPRPGTSEVMVGEAIARQYQGVALGASIEFAGRSWAVVGIFDAGNTGFSSEIWGDAEPLMQAFRRPVYSSVLLRLRDPATFPALKLRLEADPRLTLETWPEPEYYRRQSEMLANFLRILGLSLTVIFSAGAIVGAMITMYSAVASRTEEIATMRALGFQRSTILFAFLAEALMLGLVGGALGLGAASLLQWLRVSTTNFETFSELSFRFAFTPEVVVQGLAFALAMGFLGGVLPAVRAARMPLVDALRGA